MMEVLSSQSSSSSSSSSPFGYSFGGFNSTNSAFSNSNPNPNPNPMSSAFSNSAFSTPSTFSNSTRSSTSSFSNSPFSTTAFSTSSTFSDPSSLSASSSIFAPAVDSNYAFAAKAKYAQRAALASSLSGLWEGRSSRHASHISAGIHPHTDWKNCDLQFNIVDGRIHGSGISIWNDKEIPFKIQGCFDRRLERVELVKLHHGEYTTSTHYSLQIVVDGNRGAVMEGTYAHGTIRLRKIQNAKLTTSMSAHSLPTLAQMPSTLAALSSSTSSTLSPLATPLIASNTTSNLSSLLHSSPALDPAAMFMHYLFGSREGEKYYQLLQENQVDFEALKLMKESHLKELGFAMGPRLKIMNSLPGYIASQQSGTTPPTPQPIGGSQSTGSLPPTSVLLGTGFGMLGGTGPSLLSPSHTNTSSPTSTSTPNHDHAQPKIPPEFICSITHDVMEEPVVLADGHTYEKSAITTWLSTHNTSPLTGKILRSKELRPNMSLKSIIQDWRERQKWNKNQVSS